MLQPKGDADNGDTKHDAKNQLEQEKDPSKQNQPKGIHNGFGNALMRKGDYFFAKRHGVTFANIKSLYAKGDANDGKA